MTKLLKITAILGIVSVAVVSSVSWYSFQTVNVGVIGLASLLAGPTLLTVHYYNAKSSLKLLHTAAALSCMATIFLLLNVLFFSAPEEHKPTGRPSDVLVIQRPQWDLIPRRMQKIIAKITIAVGSIGVICFLISSIIVLQLPSRMPGAARQRTTV